MLVIKRSRLSGRGPLDLPRRDRPQLDHAEGSADLGDERSLVALVQEGAVEAAVRVRLELKEVREGRLLHVERGRIVREQRFRPDRRYREESYLPPVRTPREAVSCLERLAILTSPAT